MEHTDTLIIGGGQAGLALSYYLQKQGREHLVLEQAAQPAEAWRNHRWDSFTLVTPNWATRMPGDEYAAIRMALCPAPGWSNTLNSTS